MYKYLSIIIILILLNFTVKAQSKTNFEIADSLVRLSVKEYAQNLLEKTEYNFFFNSPNDYKIFSSTVVGELKKNNININPTVSDSISYNLKEINTNYPEIIKDGFFGGYLVKREIKVKGLLFLKKKNKITDFKEFNLTSQNYVKYSDISVLENIAYSFTTAKLPDEPLLSSSIEPIIAIGTAAAVVYLFFNIRSK
ncbi:MAG: hypothetical protein CR986_01200 [Ignavibacteriae bacterium]|nr:MAG: hypothetical protein CR986_01200 [Ignavibacteriota bacterium]